MTETERYLARYYELERLKRMANDELQCATMEYEARVESLLRPKNFTEPHAGKTNRVSDPVQTAAIAMADRYLGEIKKAEQTLNALVAEQGGIKDTVEKAGLNAVEKSYVILRYFKGNRTWQTAQRLQYSDRQANRYRASALRKIGAVLQDGR